MMHSLWKCINLQLHTRYRGQRAQTTKTRAQQQRHSTWALLIHCSQRCRNRGGGSSGPPAQSRRSGPRSADTSFTRLNLHLHTASQSPSSSLPSTVCVHCVRPLCLSTVQSETESQISWDYTRLHVLCNPRPVRITHHNIRAAQSHCYPTTQSHCVSYGALQSVPLIVCFEMIQLFDVWLSMCLWGD